MKGERNPSSYLTERDIYRIRHAFWQNAATITEIQNTIGKGISTQHLGDIVRHKCWTHCPYHGDENRKRTQAFDCAPKLTATDVRKIRRLFRQGVTRQQLTEHFSISNTHLGSILNYKSWKNV